MDATKRNEILQIVTLREAGHCWRAIIMQLGQRFDPYHLENRLYVTKAHKNVSEIDAELTAFQRVSNKPNYNPRNTEFSFQYKQKYLERKNAYQTNSMEKEYEDCLRRLERAALDNVMYDYQLKSFKKYLNKDEAITYPRKPLDFTDRQVSESNYDERNHLRQKWAPISSKLDTMGTEQDVLGNEIKCCSKRCEERQRRSYHTISDLKDQLRWKQILLDVKDVTMTTTKTKLNRAMGDRLTDNNPNITDLSDRNRPTKLAETFAELYDNQWTDAFDVLEKLFHSEENVIDVLLQILQDVWSFCEKKATTQMENLGLELKLADKHGKGDIAADVLKLLKDCRKAVGMSAVRNLQAMYPSYLKHTTNEKLKSALRIDDFTSECVEICWFMTIQDPPVAFAPLPRKASRFDNDYYKPYTSSGTKVEFSVWPPLLLHEGGPKRCSTRMWQIISSLVSFK